MGLSREEYVEALEKERRKMEVFQRELPLCIDLVAKVIERCRREMEVNPVVEEDCRGREAQRCDGVVGTPVLEEFIPLRPLDVEDNDNDNNNTNCRSRCIYDVDDRSSEKKSDWLKAAQLWNQNPISSKDNNSSIDVEEREKQQRKTRRCWSPELHRRFVHALQQLGGTHATPKQIRELMKVDDLTNDEVKSHLQKYRLHTRRPIPVSDSNINRKTQLPQLVFGICMHPSVFTSAGPNSSNCKPQLPLETSCNHLLKQTQSINRSPRGPIRSDDASNSGSSATSTSS